MAAAEAANVVGRVSVSAAAAEPAAAGCGEVMGGEEGEGLMMTPEERSR